MAIWDIQEETVVTGIADSQKCLSCGANVLFDPKKGAMVCNRCGQSQRPEAYEINQAMASRFSNDSGNRKRVIKPPEPEKKADEYKAEESESDEASKRDFKTSIEFASDSISDEEWRIRRKEKHEIVCNACGAVVIAEQSTMSTFCAFCGSPMIIERSLSDEFSPDYIIPYKLTKDDAKKAIKEWIASRKNLPLKFHSRANYSKITGLYVPVWLVDGDCHLDTVGAGLAKNYTSMTNCTVDFYTVKRKIDFKLKNVPFNASTKINTRMMEAIEPFNYNEMVPFNGAYLQGFFAEKYDVKPDETAIRVTNRYHDYMYDIITKHMANSQYTEYHLEENWSKADGFVFKYALVPVWVMTVKYKGVCHRILVNGQTGEVAGKPPESNFKSVMSNFLVRLRAYSIIMAFDLIFSALVGFIFAIDLSKSGIGLSKYDLTNFDFGIFKYAFLITLAISAVFTIIAANGIIVSSDYDNAIVQLAKTIGKLTIKARRSVYHLSTETNALDKIPDVLQYFDQSSIKLIEKEDKLVSSVAKDSLSVQNGGYGLF